MFNQLYIIDTDAANNYCINQPANKPCQDDVMHAIQDVMENYSLFLLDGRGGKSEISKTGNHECQQSQCRSELVGIGKGITYHIMMRLQYLNQVTTLHSKLGKFCDNFCHFTQ